jgi:hypothetical protein
MIDVSVKVPEERVAEFYAMYGSWLKSPQGLECEPEDDLDGREAGADRASTPWGPGDLELATAVWAKFSPRTKALFSTLIDEPNEQYYGEELARMHKIPNGSHGIAGVLTWPSRHCAAVGRSACWQWKTHERGTVYWMDPALASLFKHARSQDRL